MITWIIIFFCVSREIYTSSEAHYECGPHGKFEYCIDEIPGCVVGCHCHPGYYFDTDTKICEPNTKLTQFRRSYNLEPTRIPVMNNQAVSVPTPTTVNAIDEKVDAIANDADDLGDWLYNQFFKTIENQVINNTNSEAPTRRSGNHNIKTKRRTRKKNKKSKKKHKKKSLKNKLLRISEDDSMFDSSSGSSSDETDSSASESESDSSDDHDHRKILMINKKPTPPLPSFIFLPNVDTPYFPPMSIPAPPVMPMYPMIPVPPMGIMYTGDSTTCSPSAASMSTASSAATSVLTVSPGAPDPTLSTTALPETEITPTVEITTTKITTVAEEGSLKRGRAGPPHNLTPNDRKKKINRNKIMQKLRDKMKRKNKSPPITNLMENLQDLDTPYTDQHVQLNDFELQQSTINDMPKLEDVDFKYLSQLIHKIDINRTIPKVQYNPVADFPDTALSKRRNYLQNNIPQPFINPSHKIRPASKADEINDSFYTDLGKEIASLIRKLDSNGEQQIDIEIQQQNTPNSMQAIFNQNRFAPRSYWDRFVRSPLKYFQSFFTNHQKHSNENLIDIENQVKLATTVERTLSLQELENIANMMQQAHEEKKKSKTRASNNKTISKDMSNYDNNLNINLLTTMRRNYPGKVPLLNYNSPVIRRKNTEIELNNPNNFGILRRQNLPGEYVQNRTNILQKSLPENLEVINKIIPLRNILKTRPTTSPHHQADGVQRNVTHAKPLTAEQMMKYQLNPILLNYKSINFIKNNRNRYHVQRSYVPFRVPYYTKTLPSRYSHNPSYFHHEHHFDFFDK